MERIDWRNATDEQIAEANALANTLRLESRPGDPPFPLEQHIAHVRNAPSAFHMVHVWVRDEAGGLIAVGGYDHEVSADNQDVAGMNISVLPDHRRQGHGRALLGALLNEAETNGRTKIIGGTNELAPAGAAFATRIGATAGLREHTNRLLLADVDREMISHWVADGPGRAPGYSLVSHEGPYGDLTERAIGMHLLMNGAPREDLDLEDFTISPEQMADWEKSFFATGNQRWSLFVQHDATDTFVGFTEMGWNPSQPDTLWQNGTAVDPAHRGHAIGKWIKAAMIERLATIKPDAVDIRTGNADSNGPMLGINTQLGFKPFRAHTAWQVSTETLRTYIGGSTS